MVYCTKCGTQNPDEAANCSNCGASLNPAPYKEYRRYRSEDDICFGGRNYIWGILIGLFIVMIGVSSLLGGNIWDKVWPIFIILVGVVIVASSFMKKS